MSNDDFFPVNFADQYVAENEKLAKQGAFGKWIAKNRRLFLWIGVSLFALSFASLCFVVFQGLMPSMRLAAAGISYGFGEHKLAFGSVRLASGAIVERVIEPVAAVTDQGHAMLLLQQLEKHSPLTLEIVRRGYHEWLVSAQETHTHNFTWVGAKLLAEKLGGCVCYVRLGLPVNALFVDNEVIYEPHIEKEYGNTTLVERDDFYALLRTARRFIDASRQPRVITPDDVSLSLASSAMVQYITVDGRMRRTVFDGDDYRCIGSCIAVYNEK
jgi:hypothetical protein